MVDGFTRRIAVAGTLLLLIVVAASTAGHAAHFIKNRQQWSNMLPRVKDAYMTGVVDGLLGLRFAVKVPLKDDLERCFLEMDVTSKTAVDMVEAEYSDVANWGLAPTDVFFLGARKMCLSRINRYHSEATQNLELLVIAQI